MTTDVAIVGVGLHPFGRFPGVSGIEMGAVAIRRALADANVEWRDIQFAFGGSYEVDNPDAVVALMGLTGIPFTDVYNGCATAASALNLAAGAIRLGDHDLGLAVGMDKHLPGAFSADPRQYACPSWYGELGHFVTTKFFGMKINKYMHDHGISVSTLAKVAAKNYRNGALNENAFRRKPLSEEEILASPMLNFPLTQYMFCSPDEGAAAVVLCRAEHAHRYTDAPVYLRASKVRTRRLGAFEVHSPWLPIEETAGPTVDASRAAFESAGIGPEDVDVIQLQDTDAGAEVIHLAENGFCADGEQEALVAEGALEIDGRLPVNTDGGLIANGEPIGASGLRQVHEVVLQLRGRAGERQVPGTPRVGYTQLYGAPGTAGVSILSR
ncbi:MAG TPA: thiolase family protein [Acidimicrobiia bacterium]|jgi:acetyl-CoA acetyltransferase